MIESSLDQSEPMLLPGRPAGRQVRSVIGYSLLTALMIVTPMLVFVPAALLHCAVRNGRRAAWAVLVLSLAMSSLYAVAVPEASSDAQKMAWSFLAAVALAVMLPAMAAIPLVERGEPFGRVLMFLIAGTLVGLAVTEAASQLLLSFSPYAAQVAQTRELWHLVEQLYRDNKMPADVIRFAQQAGPVAVYFLPSQIIVSLAVVFTLSMMMYGRLRAWQNDPARPYLLRNLVLPDWLLFVFVACGLTPLVSGLLQKLAANVLFVVAFLYLLQGLAVFRAMLLGIGAGVVGTLFGWAMLAITIPFSLLALAVTGLFDSFFDFRHFKKRKDDSHESHSD
jgi:hypothetical protein